MKVALLDDEKLALNYLEHQLQKVAPVEIIGKFNDPMALKKFLLHQDVDVVFLDIHLPEMNGIELAEQLLEKNPGLNIVFCTAYDEYAIKAFELNAVDYLMKPVGTERLLKTLNRIQASFEVDSNELSSIASTIRMKTCDQVMLEIGDNSFAPIRWRTSKAQELFLYMLQHRGMLVRKSVLIELLWPDYEPNKAYSQLYTAVYHIRKTLEPWAAYFIISNISDGYLLNIENVNLDVEEWENSILSGRPVTEETIEDYEKLMESYIGDYLQKYDYWWAESERHRLKLLWLRVALKMAEWYASSGQQEKAIKQYIELCERHPQAEEAHFALMKLYDSTGNHLSVHRQFRLLTTILLEELNERPSPYILDWYNQWSQENKE